MSLEWSLTTVENNQQSQQTKPTSTTFTHIQIAPSKIWSINHNLNKRPSVTIVDSAGSVVIGDVQYIDDNNIKITFSSAFSGNVYLN